MLEESPVLLQIFNIAGKEITTLVHEIQQRGEYEIVWNAENYPSGIYICQFKVHAIIQTKKLILVKRSYSIFYPQKVMPNFKFRHQHLNAEFV